MTKGGKLTKKEIQAVHGKLAAALHQLGYQTKNMNRSGRDILFWRGASVYRLCFEETGHGWISMYEFTKEPFCPLRITCGATCVMPIGTGDILKMEYASSLTPHLKKAVACIDTDQYYQLRVQPSQWIPSADEVLDALEFYGGKLCDESGQP